MPKILPIPEIPEDLRAASRSGGLIPFVGAGVSILAGAPGWSGFADAAIRSFAGKGKISLSECEQLKGASNKIKLAIARSLETQHGSPIDFEKILHEKAPLDTGMEKGRELYSHLSKLSTTFVTTNYDRWLDCEYAMTGHGLEPGAPPKGAGALVQRTPIYLPEDFIPVNLKPDTVIHLHGSVIQPRSMIMTTADYTKHYSNDRGKNENRVLTFLDHLFSANSILFVGYGLDELEILEYVIQKSGSGNTSGTRPKKHFLLQGYFSHEDVLASAMADYYGSFGIQLLPFLRDENDWWQLTNVLKDFAQKLPFSAPLQAEKLAIMEALTR